jgi:MinD superfamily P-loop ATPase
MKIAIASGKGGTGKTTVAVALAFSVPGPVRLLDCDVEEPNCHFFIQPEIQRKEKVFSPVPKVDQTKCNGCGECARVCQFSAIVPLGKKTMVFPELCHGCGGCSRICPTGAISEIQKEIGTLEIGYHGDVEFVSGSMNVGQAMSPPVIRAVKHHELKNGLTILDCPPGTSCPFVTTIKGCDAALLVTEPTPFGLYDLKLAVETIRELNIPFAVAVNRSIGKENRITEYCCKEGIQVLMHIPEDRQMAEAYSRGETLTAVMPEMRSVLARLPEELMKQIRVRERSLA